MNYKEGGTISKMLKESSININTTKGSSNIEIRSNINKVHCTYLGQFIYNFIGEDYDKLEVPFRELEINVVIKDIEGEIQIEFTPEIKGDDFYFICKILVMTLNKLYEEL